MIVCPYCGDEFILRSRVRWYDYSVLWFVRPLRCRACWRRFYALRLRKLNALPGLPGREGSFQPAHRR
jgi:hypothetical protein